MKVIIYIYLFFFVVSANAQNFSFDSLMDLTKSNPHLGNRISDSLLNHEKDISQSRKADLLEIKLQAAFRMEKYDVILITALAMIEHFTNTKDSTELANAMNRAAYAYFHFGEYMQAQNYHFKAIEIRKSLNNEKALAESYINIGLVFKAMRQFNEASQFERKALEIGVKTKDSAIISYALNNLASIYKTENKIDSALITNRKSLNLKKQLNLKKGILNSYGNLGNIYKETENYDSAVYYYTKTLELSKELNFKIGLARTYNSLGEIYHNRDQTQKAENYMLKAYKIGNEIQHAQIISLVLGSLAEFYLEVGDYEKSANHYKKKLAYQDSLFDIEKNKELIRQRSLLKVHEKVTENERLKKENELQKANLKNQRLNIFYILALLIITLIAFIIFYKQRKRETKHLSELNNQLEERVKERTSELNKEVIEKEETARELEMALAKAQRANAMKTAFLRNVSHEIRTPLNAILGFTNLLIFRNACEKNKEYITHIEKGSRSLLNIIDNLIDLSGLETGNIELKLLKTNIGEIVKAIQLKTENYIYQHEDIKFKFITQDVTDIEINTDINRVVQILLSFIDNAFKFTKKGSITLNYSMIDSQIIFAVNDTGPGISPEKQKILFNRYQTTSDSTLKEGAGLGLTLAKNIAEKLHGRIWVESESGSGSTFYLELPIT